MISFLKGIIEEIGDDSLFLDVNGVGYQVYAPSRVLAQVAEGEVIKIHTHTYVREDALALYGFTETTDRAMFEKLLSVSGVGAKMAMAILSGLSSQDIANAVTAGDIATLTQISGVGKKLAERLILELKNKLGAFVGGNVTSIGGGKVTAAGMPQSAHSDVLSALINMGFKMAQAQQALAVAADEAGAEADFGTLLKTALKTLRSA